MPRNTAQEIADGLKNKYYVSVATEYDDLRLESERGLAILSKQKPTEISKLYLGSEEKRIVLRATFKKATQEFDVINTHLYWKPYNLLHNRIRLGQVKRLVSWAQSDREVIICGDMNTAPRSRSMRYFYRRGYHSGYKLFHGKEPKWTCANPVGHPERTLRDRLALYAYNLVKRRRIGIWRGVLDYILVTKDFKAIGAATFGNQPSKKYARIYPSDHLGVYVDLSLPIWRKKP